MKSSPDMPGMPMSDSNRSGQCCPRRSSASCPLVATDTLAPSISSSSLKVSTVPESSSTSRISVPPSGSDGAGDRSELALFEDASAWKPIGKSGGWKYKDKTGAIAGIRKIVLKNGQITVVAKGESWLFAPDGSPNEEVTVHVQIGNNSYCSKFGGTVQRNEEGLYKARDAGAPDSCAVQVCGNNIQEVGELCDDGNLTPDDGCGNDCQEALCVGDEYASTFEAIQKTVLDPYGCTSSLCHGKHDIAKSSEPASRTHAARVETTCGGCHGNDAVIQQAKLPGGNIVAMYHDSIHGAKTNGKGADAATAVST